MKDKSDEELISLLNIGDLSAFAEIYERYWKVLLTKAFDRLKSREDAEEVVQELFIDLWRRRQQLAIQFTFKTYIFAALRYQVMSHVAKNQFRKDQISIDEPGFLEFWSREEDFHTMEMRELQQQINLVVEGLPEKCKIIFKMSRNEGMSAKKIADELNLSPRTVETQIGKAIKVLKSRFGGSNSLVFVVVLELIGKNNS